MGTASKVACDELIGERFEVRRGYRATSSFDDAVGVDEKPVAGLQRRSSMLADVASEPHRQRWSAPQPVSADPSRTSSGWGCPALIQVSSPVDICNEPIKPVT